MARIQIDFDEVMRFGDLHGDIGRALDVQRGVFRLDAARLDQIVDAFGLQRTTSSPHFQGMSIAAALGDADARAGRTSHTLVQTSSRIFHHASRVADDRFDWAGVLRPMSGPFGMDLVSRLGGEFADWAADTPRVVTPAVRFVGPLFAGVTGVLDLIDGTLGFLDPSRDGWSTVSSSLRLVSGGLSIFVAIGGAAALVGAAFVSAPVLVVVGAVAAVVSFGALMIENRETVAGLFGGGGRWAAGVARGIAETVTETTHDLLSTAGDVWRNTVGVAWGRFGSAVDALWSATEEVHDLLVATGMFALRQFGLTPGREVQPAPVQGPFRGLAAAQPSPSSQAGSSRAHAAVVTGRRDWREIQRLYDQWATGRFAAGGESHYQCTAWANFRWQELGYSGDAIGGDGWAMADRAPGEVSQTPTLHAMASYGRGVAGDYGHVMIVEEISPDGTRIRVSEMNVGDKDYEVGRPSEYRDTKWITRRGDGLFYSDGGQPIRFAAFPR